MGGLPPARWHHPCGDHPRGRQGAVQELQPAQATLDVYLVRLKREKEVYKPKFKWLGRAEFKFKDESKTVRRKVGVKLAELAIPERVMYVGVMIIRDVYKGQFDDTSVSTFKMSSVWGEQ